MVKLGKLMTTAAAVTAVGVALVGCRPLDPGSAVVYDTGRITDQQLADEVNATAAGLQIAPNERVTQFTVNRLVTSELVEQGATMLGVSVSDAEVDQAVADLITISGGLAELEAAAARQGLPADGIVEQVRINVIADKMGDILAPGEDDDSKLVAVSRYLVAVSEDINLQVNPRFGTWEPERLLVGPPPNDLSEPEVSGNPLVNSLIQR